MDTFDRFYTILTKLSNFDPAVAVSKLSLSLNDLFFQKGNLSLPLESNPFSLEYTPNSHNKKGKIILTELLTSASIPFNITMKPS